MTDVFPGAKLEVIAAISSGTSRKMYVNVEIKDIPCLLSPEYTLPEGYRLWLLAPYHSWQFPLGIGRNVGEASTREYYTLISNHGDDAPPADIVSAHKTFSIMMEWALPQGPAEVTMSYLEAALLDKNGVMVEKCPVQWVSAKNFERESA